MKYMLLSFCLLAACGSTGPHQDQEDLLPSYLQITLEQSTRQKIDIEVEQVFDESQGLF